MTTSERTVGRYLRWVLAALSLGAGAVHFAVSGEHYDVSWVHGTFFAVVAWVQLSWAVALVVRPTRRLLTAGVLFYAGIVDVWAMSRIWGVPIGPNAWTPESVTVTDALTSGFELGVMVLALAVLVRPAVAQRELRPGFGLSVVGTAGFGVATIASLALTPAFASSHNHRTFGTHDHSAAAAQADQRLDSATRATLKEQLTAARAFVMQYPTAAVATAAGYRLSGGFVPGAGAHYTKLFGLSGHDAVDPNVPFALLYDGTSPTSEIVGVMYYAKGNRPPAGFAGPNDHWHRHRKCVQSGPTGEIEARFPADTDAGAAQCVARGNELRVTGWMVHAWVVPSWESPEGVFSHDNPDLRCADGTYHTNKAGFCQGT